MSTEPLVLSIDLGTGGPKVSLIDARGRVAASAARPVATRTIPPDGSEQDAEEVWRAIADAIAEVVAAAGRPAEDIVGVSLASQYFSVVPVDRRGHPVGSLVLWMDTRGAAQARAIYGRHDEAFETWVDAHGLPPLPSGNDSLSHMLWIQHERPDVYARAHKLLEPMDFIAARLTGVCSANACTAFSMLLTDNRAVDTIDYHPELVRMSGIDREKLPDLVPVGSPIGSLLPEVAAELGLSPRAQVFSGMNDSQAIAVGTGTFAGEHGGINMGTTSALLVHVPFKRSDLAAAIVSMPSPIAGLYVAMAENGLGAKALETFLRDVVFADDALAAHSSPDVFAGLEAAVRGVPPGSGGLLFLPWLVGAHAPSPSSHARGGFLNLSLGASRASLVRSILEGVAFNLRWLLPAVEEFAGHPLDHLRVAGGAALSDEWCQILADVTRRPTLQLRDPRHVINRATAFLAFERLGLARRGDLSSFCPIGRTFEPRGETEAVYERMFAQFRAAFEQNRPIFEALND